jgi:hypothetical protein
MHLNKYLICSVYVCFVLIASLACVNQKSAFPLKLEISSPKDGETLRTNVSKITGTFSGQNILIAANGVLATISGNEFYAYVELFPGNNTVIIDARSGNEHVSKNLNLAFKRPLALALTRVPLASQLPTQPITVTGEVSDSQAKVQVNNVSANVSRGGSFSAVIPPAKRIQATAQLGQDTTADYINYTINDFPEDIVKGMPFINIKTPLIIKPNSIQIVNFKLGASNPRYRGIIDPYEFRWKISSVPGMEISIEPKQFYVYPYASYDITLIIKTSTEIPEGDYPIQFANEYDSGNNIPPGLLITVKN